MTGETNGQDTSYAGLENSGPDRSIPNGAVSISGGGRSGNGGIAAVDNDTALVAMIERAARDPAVDIDKMERLFQMHERVAARNAEAAYNAAMAAAQAEMVPVTRNRKNTHTNSQYADLFAIADAALPIAHKHGFGLSFSEFKSEQPGCQGIACTVSHASGHSKHHEFNVPIDAAGSQGKVNKTATQAYGSTFTYGRRYATCGVFNIAVKDNDGNPTKQPDATLSEAEEQKLRDALDFDGSDIPAFCAHFKIDKLSDLPSAKLDGALKAIAKRRQFVEEAAKKEAAQ